MVSHLYEALGVAQDATPEQIRKAYRKKALQTHPDRLPPGANQSDKSRAEEQFRIVNNAYEVLSDEEKRRVYDRYGEYPPPEPETTPYERGSHRRSSRHRSNHNQEPFTDPFNDPFFTNPFGRHTNFAFTDPFTLFESMFGDLHRQMHDPFFADPFSHHHHDPFSRSPFGSGSLFDRLMDPHSVFPMLPPTESSFMNNGNRNGGRMQSFASSRMIYGGNVDGNGQWVSQSKVTRTINGVTESVMKRTDANGNEHVTYSYPDGRQRYLINGVEQQQQPQQAQLQQPQQQQLPPPSSRRHRSQRMQAEDSYSQPPPPYPGPPASHKSVADQYARHQQSPYAAGPYNSANIKHDMERERHHRERIIEDMRPRSNSHRQHYSDHRDSHQHKKRWWKGEF